MISQSGNVGINLTMQQRHLRMSYMVTVGNQAGGGVEGVQRTGGVSGGQGHGLAQALPVPCRELS
jgi:hypothetical protein